MAFTHARRIAGYSWPLYAGAVGAVAVGAVAIGYPGTPPALRWTALAGTAVVLWFSIASFLAFHWMFDRSGLLAGRWVAEEAVPAPGRWVLIHAGLAETTVPLGEVFPGASGRVLDVFDPASMTEPALGRARPGSAGASAPDALPVEAGGADLVLVMLAAHEIRDGGARDRFFRELARIVAPGGRVVVVEHLRDGAAALAFGPGAFHFYPRGEWLRLAGVAGLEVERERRMTPWVRVFTCRPRAGAGSSC